MSEQIADAANRLQASFQLIQFAFQAIIDARDKNDGKQIDEDILVLLSKYHYLKIGQAILRASDNGDETAQQNAIKELDESSISKLDAIFSVANARMSNGPFTRLKLAAISKALGEMLDFRTMHSRIYVSDIVNFFCESEINYYRNEREF